MGTLLYKSFFVQLLWTRSRIQRFARDRLRSLSGSHVLFDFPFSSNVKGILFVPKKGKEFTVIPCCEWSIILLLLRVREAFLPRRRPHSGPIELEPVRQQTPTSLYYMTILLML